ncbi:sarcosine oxidase subunit gamma family protein [Ruegeria sp. 2205SS24-7]|uniref:sarcosine oxidase subunit gamma n=1 Tax=Ruegeria discodermiae TaxID=3064389 RepID=UPI00274162BC|nr:sarcosine oxidase subunit gamma family protein [Ruegeria sp. 2205SS24-7]MDP5216668.1 sarcosine oxidase subunit gamma family protein [Ruegeria sp. 2205SS24-7]
MSEPISALNGARIEGIAVIEELGLQGMITLRGDHSDKGLVKAATGATGQKMPGQRQALVEGESGLCWMSPDELLVLVPYTEVDAKLVEMQKALGSSHARAVNVSDARAVFRVSGPNAREVLAKMAPVDLSPEGFKPGDFRRTRLAQVAAAFWMEEDGAFRIVCFRSVAGYVFNLLQIAAQPGSDVGAF